MLSPGYWQTSQVSTAWIWYMLLAVLVLLLIFWWLNRSPRRESTPAEPREMAPVRGEQTADDLKRIEGIGPKVAQVLQDADIKTFEALARADPGNVKQILNEAGLQMMNPDGWIEQAQLAAKGDWKGLEQLQKKLIGGRKK